MSELLKENMPIDYIEFTEWWFSINCSVKLLFPLSDDIYDKDMRKENGDCLNLKIYIIKIVK